MHRRNSVHVETDSSPTDVLIGRPIRANLLQLESSEVIERCNSESA